MKDAERTARSSGDRIENEMGQIGEEAGSEFQQNMGEALASGDLSGVVGDTLAGLTTQIKGWQAGAIGVLAGVAVFGIQKIQENMEAWRAAIDSASDEMVSAVIEAQGKLTEAATSAAAAQWIANNEDAWNQIKDRASEAGVNAEDYVFAMFEGGDAAAEMESKLAGVLTEGRDYETVAGRTKVNLDDSAEAARQMLDDFRSYGGKLGDAVTYAQDVAGANERAAAAAEREANAAERTANARRNTPAVPANTSPAYGNGAS
jgi:hypothetical protein